jgi:predicted enzyme related to lactoylglutathione lyase
MTFSSQITFLYFDELTTPAAFFEDTLGLETADDQGFAKIYRIAAGAFLGIVDAAKGHCRAAGEQNTLITLVTDDVQRWYTRLKDRGVAVEGPPKINAAANVECFFFEGPGSYAFEVQRFLDPAVAAKFSG